MNARVPLDRAIASATCIPRPRQEPAMSAPAPSPAEQAGELREQVARWLFGLHNPDRYWDAEWVDRAPIYAEVDAGPLAPLLAKLQAVEELAEEIKDRQVKAIVSGSYSPTDSRERARWVGRSTGYGVCGDLLRRALAGQHTTDEETHRG